MKLWLIAKSNMKKKKGNVVIIMFLVAMATLMFYVGVSVLKNISHFLDDNYEKQNGAHVAMAIGGVDNTKLENSFCQIDGYDKMEREDAIVSRASCEVQKKNDNENGDNMTIVFMDMDTQRTISDFTIHDKGKTKKKNSIVVPMYMKVGKGYETGDEITFRINEQMYTFEIYGFVEDVMFASPSNVTIYKCFITNESMSELKNSKYFVQKDWYNIMLDDASKSSEFDEAICKKIDQMEEITEISLVANYETMRVGTSMFVSIIMAIFTIFSLMFVIIAVVVMRFNVVANMEENITNIGILQVVGYTSRQFAGATIIEYLIVTAAGIVLGFGMTYPANSYMTGIISRSMGLTWKCRVDVLVGMLTVAMLFVVIFGVILVTTRKFKKISTLSALRDGIETHNFKHNFMPFHKSFLGVNMTIGWKDILHNKKQSVSILIVVSMLSFISAAMLIVYSNFVNDTDYLVNLVGIEKSDITIQMKDENRERIMAEVEKDSDVTQVIASSSWNVTVCDGEKEKIVVADIYSDISKLRVNSLLRGRLPRQKNEISMTNRIADEFQVDVGDLVTLKVQDKKLDFLVTGITQQMSNMGIRIAMEENALKRFVPEYSTNYINVYLKNGVSIEEKVTFWEEKYMDEDVAITNFEETYSTILGTYVSSLESICIVFALITVFVVSLILILLARMKFIRERKYMGVYKALGYTSMQLMKQTLMSFIPVVAVGTLIGCIAAVSGVNPIFAWMLSACGIEKCNMAVNAWILVATFAVIVLVAIIVVTICSLRIRKVEAYKMITEQ